LCSSDERATCPSHAISSTTQRRKLPRAFLERRQRHSLVDSAERLMKLLERRASIGGEAFVHDHYEDVMHVMFWLGIDQFDRRAVNRQSAERALGARVECPA